MSDEGHAPWMSNLAMQLVLFAIDNGALLPPNMDICLDNIQNKVGELPNYMNSIQLNVFFVHTCTCTCFIRTL